MTPDLFPPEPGQAVQQLGPRSWVLRGHALPRLPRLLPALDRIERRAPFRRMTTPGGFTMAVAMTNCGHLGWITDRRGYRYADIDPVTGLRWPAMPAVFRTLARDAAAAVGFAGFAPDACLVNRYVPGARLSLHQDRNERDFTAPIVSVSLGMAAVFLFGGHARSDRPVRVPLRHGDVVVWGGEDRLRYHGVMPLRGEPHPLLGETRINLTFRKAG